MFFVSFRQCYVFKFGSGPRPYPNDGPCPNDCPNDGPCPNDCPNDRPCPNDCPNDGPCPNDCPNDGPCPNDCPNDRPCPNDCPNVLIINVGTAMLQRRIPAKKLASLFQKHRKLRKLVRKYIKKSVPKSSKIHCYTCAFSYERKKLLRQGVLFAPYQKKTSKKCRHSL